MEGMLPMYRGLGPVVQSWGQSAPAGEWLAIVAAATVWPAHVSSPRCGCLSVVRATHQQSGQVMRRGGFWAGALRQAISTTNLQGRIWPLLKIKAHRTIRADARESERAEILGNDFADAAAKDGARAHPQLATGEVRCAEHSWDEQVGMLKVAAKVLAVFPTLAQHFKREAFSRPAGGATCSAPTSPTASSCSNR